MKGERLAILATAVVLATLAAVGRPSLGAVGADATPALRITSPLGRTGLSGTIRIVARLEGPAVPAKVKFYVNDEHLADDEDGPPFEALWADENPFERKEITARAELESGLVLADTVVLDPLTVTDAVDVASVRLEASVLDAKGRFIKNLEPDDFLLFEDSQPQKIELLAQEREAALFTLLVDSSQSMALRAAELRSAARAMLASLEKDDHVLVAPFSRGILAMTGPTTDRATALDAIGAIRPSGGTAILDSVQQAARALANRDERCAIVLITDGYDEHSTADIEATIATLRASDVTLYVIGIGGIAGISLKGEALLKQLAEQTGGRAWFPRDSRRLAEAYTLTADDVRHKYLVAYTPSNRRRDGTWRTITLKTATDGYRVRTRDGYTAPLAPPVRTSMEFTAVAAGNVPASITRDVLEVLENGVPQEVDTFHEAVLPITIMMALDASGSMKRSAAQAQAAARSFVQAVRAEDELGMIMFADKSQFVHLANRRRDWSLEAIDKYVAEGGTSLYDAVYDAIQYMDRVKEGRRVVVVVTDGRDENAASNGPGSLRTWDEVLAKLRQIEATVYAVGVGSRVDRTRLQQLADLSGGAAYFPADATTLAADYHKILDELRRRYVLGYESTNRLRDGGWRKVEIRTRVKGISVRSRGGYFAPAQ